MSCQIYSLKNKEAMYKTSVAVARIKKTTDVKEA